MRLLGRKIYHGTQQGETLVSSQGISFFGGVDPDSGVVVERGHELEGQSIAGKVLVFPTGKGSTVGSYTLYRLKARQVAPLAIVNSECETITAVGCIIAEIPCVDQVDLARLSTGQRVMVDGELGAVQILGPAAPPSPLRGSEPGSFAEYTFRERLPEIARRLLEQEEWSPPAVKRLKALADELPNGRIRPLRDLNAPDNAFWQDWLIPFQGMSWLEAPWFAAEMYFFRRILEATGYFRPGVGENLDPFRSEKQPSLTGLAEQIESACSALEETAEDDPLENLTRLLHTVVWGNQADLSIWPAGSEPPANHSGEQRRAHLLVDQSRGAGNFIFGHDGGLDRVDFILDNVGLELGYDLLLADYFLRQGLAHRIVFHAKPYPTYVSDATIRDVEDTIFHLQASHKPAVRNLSQRLSDHLSSGRLDLRDHPYWISPLPGWEMPEDLREDLYQTDLLISKGDANYRRWLGDRHWEFETPLEKVLAYRPAPLLLIRVLKSELMVGLDPGKAQQMSREDPKWLFNGRWGVIQFVR